MGSDNSKTSTNTTATLDGQWTVQWSNGDEEAITVKDNVFEVFGSTYSIAFDAPTTSYVNLTFNWSDGTVQTASLSLKARASTIEWTTTHPGYTTITWTERNPTTTGVPQALAPARQTGLRLPEALKSPGTLEGFEQTTEHPKHSVHAVFINNTQHDARIFWIDYSGQEEEYYVLRPGNAYSQQTYDSHPWIARTATDGHLLLVAGATNHVIKSGNEKSPEVVEISEPQCDIHVPVLRRAIPSPQVLPLDLVVHVAQFTAQEGRGGPGKQGLDLRQLSQAEWEAMIAESCSERGAMGPEGGEPEL